MRKLLPVASIVGVLLLYGCSIIETNNTVSSSEMAQSIKTQLASDPQLQGIAVDTRADKNEVTLSGSVPTEDLRTKAVDLVKNGRPNLVVTDKIDVQPSQVARSEYTEEMARTARQKAKEFGDKLGNSLDDAWIRTKIKAKLIDNPDTPARNINIDVIDQVVTLHGAVGTVTAKDEAERTAKQTEGVKRVNNLLKVQAG